MKKYDRSSRKGHGEGCQESRPGDGPDDGVKPDEERAEERDSGQPRLKAESNPSRGHAWE